MHSASRSKYSAQKYPDLAARIAEAVALQTAVNVSLEVSSKPEMPFQLEPNNSSVFTDKLEPPAQVKKSELPKTWTIFKSMRSAVEKTANVAKKVR